MAQTSLGGGYPPPLGRGGPTHPLGRRVYPPPLEGGEGFEVLRGLFQKCRRKFVFVCCLFFVCLCFLFLVHPLPWPAMAGHALPWPAMTGHGRPWPVMPCHCRPWPPMAGHALSCRAIAGHGLPWPTMACHGRPLPAIAGQKFKKMRKGRFPPYGPI